MRTKHQRPTSRSIVSRLSDIYGNCQFKGYPIFSTPNLGTKTDHYQCNADMRSFTVR